MKRAFYVAGLLTVLWLDSAVACTCSQRENVCQMYSGAAAVFVGEVVSASVPADFFSRWAELWQPGLAVADLVPENRERQLREIRRIVESALGREFSQEEQQALETVRSRADLSSLLRQLEPTARIIQFRVVESFKGPEGPSIELWTPIPQGGNCEFAYQVGETYLVYGQETGHSQKLRAGGICSRSQTASYAQDEVDHLRRLKEGAKTGKVFGFVREQPEAGANSYELLRELSKPNPKVGQPVAGARVHLSGAQEWATSTDDQGNFEFRDVPSGDYQINARINGFLAGSLQKLRFYEGGCFEQRLWLRRETGFLAGTISEANGMPVSGQQVDVIPVHSSAIDRDSSIDLRPTTDDNGRFETVLPVGEYVVGMNIRVPVRQSTDGGVPYATSYYPGVPNREAATAVTISEWQGTRIQFSVERLVERNFRGIVVWPNGGPAPGTVVRLEEPNRAAVSVDRAETSADGSFELTGFAGVKYRIVANALHAETNRHYHGAAEGAVPFVRLVLQPIDP